MGYWAGLKEDDVRLQKTVADVWNQRLAEQTSWPPGSSDYERLRAAFDDLEKARIIARMNYWYFRTDALEEIEYEKTRDDQYGFAFFTSQDSEDLAEEPAFLFLAYSFLGPIIVEDERLLRAARGGDKQAEATIRDQIGQRQINVGVEICAALQRHGLKVDWDGTTRSRIGIEIPHWRKPLPPEDYPGIE